MSIAKIFVAAGLFIVLVALIACLVSSTTDGGTKTAFMGLFAVFFVTNFNRFKKFFMD